MLWVWVIISLAREQEESQCACPGYLIRTPIFRYILDPSLLLLGLSTKVPSPLLRHISDSPADRNALKFPTLRPCLPVSPCQIQHLYFTHSNTILTSPPPPPQRLKSSLWFNIGKMVDLETINLGVNATPQFIGSLTELVWTQIGTSSLPSKNLAFQLSYDDERLSIAAAFIKPCPSWPFVLIA